MKRSLLLLLGFGLVSFMSVNAQNRFNGYSLTVKVDNARACPLQFLPQQNRQNHIEVFLAGTNLQKPATGLTACDNSTIQGNRVGPNGADQKWCFQGPEDLYEIKLSNGESYLWPTMSGRDIGFYNVKDFRPMRRVEGATPKYVYTDPPDYTKAIRNAIMIMASRQGGTLYFPDGDYIVGTTDGNTRDPSYEAITVPSGVTIVGASGNSSNAGNNMPDRSGAARIRLRNNKQSIFRIGGCTKSVTVRNIELLGNAALFAEAPRDTTGTYGVEALGKWTIDPVTKVQSGNTSQFFRFENVVFQDFDTGMMVHNANSRNCNPAEQLCNSWQFDFIRVDHGTFINNHTGISIDTFNTDWTIANSTFSYMAAKAPGTGIRINRGGVFVIQNSFGGGYSYGRDVGGTFLYIDSVQSVTMIASSSERGQRSIFVEPTKAGSNQMLNIIGSVFNDPIELNGRMNFVSMGNFYYSYTFKVAPEVVINSVGDKFCNDPNIFPGHCNDQTGTAGRPVNDPGFKGGQIMFRTGRPPEGRGKDRLNREPNFFGYDVEINKGLLQHDPDTTFRDITTMAAPAETGTRVKDGAIVYCKDCKKAANGVCSQGQAGVDGAFAKRINNQWRCD